MDNHNEASVSLKVLILIFALLLVGALTYLVVSENKTPYDSDVVSESTDNQVVAKEEKALACGDTDLYGFSMTFGELWNGYKIKQVNPDYAIVTCYINVPTTSKEDVWTTESTTNFANYASVFAVSVYTPAQWIEAETEPNKPSKLASNDKYVWGWAPGQALPEDLQAKKIASDTANVIATFKLTN